MAVQPVGEGFFTTGGTLRSTTSGNTSSTTSSTDPITDQVTAQTLAALTSEADAAIVHITSQLNAAGTGFDSGVADLVQKAVAAGEEKLSQNSANATPATTVEIGGTYQNSIISGGTKVTA